MVAALAWREADRRVLWLANLHREARDACASSVWPPPASASSVIDADELRARRHGRPTRSTPRAAARRGEPRRSTPMRWRASSETLDQAIARSRRAQRRRTTWRSSSLKDMAGSKSAEIRPFHRRVRHARHRPHPEVGRLRLRPVRPGAFRLRLRDGEERDPLFRGGRPAGDRARAVARTIITSPEPWTWAPRADAADGRLRRRGAAHPQLHEIHAGRRPRRGPAGRA